mmetsp:Transcript_18137/g.36646  ORF Transcript_18137/g.36646 Transcript_18137/m.36646 type:complete len:252 (+) Transcript_18137:586-1341(+)
MLAAPRGDLRGELGDRLPWGHRVVALDGADGDCTTSCSSRVDGVVVAQGGEDGLKVGGGDARTIPQELGSWSSRIALLDRLLGVEGEVVLPRRVAVDILQGRVVLVQHQDLDAALQLLDEAENQALVRVHGAGVGVGLNTSHQRAVGDDEGLRRAPLLDGLVLAVELVPLDNQVLSKGLESPTNELVPSRSLTIPRVAQGVAEGLESVQGPAAQQGDHEGGLDVIRCPLEAEDGADVGEPVLHVDCRLLLP